MARVLVVVESIHTHPDDPDIDVLVPAEPGSLLRLHVPDALASPGQHIDRVTLVVRVQSVLPG